MTKEHSDNSLAPHRVVWWTALLIVLFILPSLQSLRGQTSPTPDGHLELKVNNGTGTGGGYRRGDVVPVSAIVPAGYEFLKWFPIAGDGRIGDPLATQTDYTMGQFDAEITGAFAKLEAWFPPGLESNKKGLLLPKPIEGMPTRLEHRLRVTLDRGNCYGLSYADVWAVLQVKINWAVANRVKYFTEKTGGTEITNQSALPKGSFESTAENIYEVSIWYEGRLTLEQIEQLIQNGSSPNVQVQLSLVVNVHARGEPWNGDLLPVELISDLNNDGQINTMDNPLRGAAMASGVTDETKDKGTEFIFHNDTLSNGIWDKEDTDPARPATEKYDDDAEEIIIKPVITEGQIWLDHPAIAKLSFYKSRECNSADKVNLSPTSKFAISASNPFPDKIFMRADVDGTPTYPKANPQFEGDLVLKIKVGTAEQEVEAMKMKLTIVRHFGARKFFNTARDYIFENNSKLYTAEKNYPTVMTQWKLCILAEELSSLRPIETYHGKAPVVIGAVSKPVGPFGFGSVASFNSDLTVLVNGPQVFFSNIKDIGPVKVKHLCLINGLYSPNPIMTDKMHGRLILENNNWFGEPFSEYNPASSDDIHLPYGSPLAGIDAEHISQSEEGVWSFDTGFLPLSESIKVGVGGLSDNHNSELRNNHDICLIGHSDSLEEGKGCIIIAAHKTDFYLGAGLNISEFVKDAVSSKIKKHPVTGKPKLYMTDSGYATVALAHKTPSDELKTVIFGPPIDYWVTAGQAMDLDFDHAPVNYHLGVPYFTNVYTGFKSNRPRDEQ